MMKVLIVDDDRIALEMLQRQLSGWGYNVTTASDGSEAWSLFQNDDFSLVISDWQMPNMGGLDLLGRIRSSQPSQYVYCILLTVRSKLDDLVEGMDAGADDFLSKPFEPNELRVRLNAGKRIIDLERKLSSSNARMKRELDSAASIQRSLLPARLPRLETSRFAWNYKPCDELGGDILNVIPLDQDYVAFYLLDVAGHGVSAALLSVALSRLLTTATNSSSLVRDRIESPPGYRIVPPCEVLARLNHRFYVDLKGEQFFTIMYGVLNLDTLSLCYASGGHNPSLLLRHDGTVRKLASTGPIVGVFSDAQFEQTEVQMRHLDRLFVYSDGVTEAENSQGEQFGLERLIKLAQQGDTGSVQDTLDVLFRRIEDWTHPAGCQDDVSCLAAEALDDGYEVRP